MELNIFCMCLPWLPEKRSNFRYAGGAGQSFFQGACSLTRLAPIRVIKTISMFRFSSLRVFSLTVYSFIVASFVILVCNFCGDLEKSRLVYSRGTLLPGGLVPQLV